VEGSCEYGNEPPSYNNARKLASGYTTDGLSSSAQLHIVSDNY
jgi:hypothetical protein